LDYFASDNETKIIASYIEGVKDGGRFAKSLALAAKKKPVIILKGGRSRAGAKLALSHTASLAGSIDVWRAALKQYGAVAVRDFQELTDQVVAFTFLPPITGKRVIIAGGGGGKSMVSADVWEEEGFELPEFSTEFRRKLKEKAPRLWDWIRNPMDFSLFQGGLMADANLSEWLSEEERYDLFVANLTQDDPLPDDVWEKALAPSFLSSVLEIRKSGRPLICVIETGEIGPEEMKNWKWRAIAEMRRQMIDQGLAVFRSPHSAAQAVGRLVDYWVWQKNAGKAL
jgi:acyl-CoA synthetase (NDP forming)